MNYYYVYILTNKNNRVLYVGITNDLEKRLSEHYFKANPKSFTSIYNLNKLIYYEVFNNTVDAIAREKQIKGGSRKKKIDLVSKFNPLFEDLMIETASENFLKKISSQ